MPSFRIDVTVAGVDVQVRRDAVGKARFPCRRVLRAYADLAIEVEVVRQRRFADKADLQDIIRRAA
mgnify:CR=1 FL=1